MSNFSAILGKSSAMDTVIRSARIIAATDVTVLLKGETGTGKEVLAKAIQLESRRANKPFITLNNIVHTKASGTMELIWLALPGNGTA